MLNVGLRWEYFGPLSEEHNLISNLGNDGQLAMVGSDGWKGLQPRLNNFAPRIGFAWNVHPEHRGARRIRGLLRLHPTKPDGSQLHVVGRIW